MMRIKDLVSLPKEVHCKGEIGIEIEIEGSNLPTVGHSTFWKSVGDSSLRGESVEYVLRKPLSRENSKRSLSALHKLFKKKGTTIHDSVRTGVHVHVNVQDLNIVQVYNFIICYLILEEVLTKYCGENREGNHFCLRACDAEYLLEVLKDAIATNNVPTCFRDDNVRYSALNVNALTKFGSLEFRALKTPDYVPDIGYWIDMLTSIKDYSLTFDMPLNILQGFSEAQYVDFIESALGDSFHFVSKYDGLNDMAKRGMRNAQEVVYAVDWDKYVKSLENRVFGAVSGKVGKPKGRRLGPIPVDGAESAEIRAILDRAPPTDYRRAPNPMVTVAVTAGGRAHARYQ